MANLTKGSWVVVADGEKALFLENTTDDADPYLRVWRKKEQENPSDAEQSANKRGRMADGPDGNGPRSAFEDTDWHELAKERFADDLAEILYKEAHKGAFDRLVLVAAPNVLGQLRDKMHKEVSARVIGEIPKTLTNHSLDEIEEIVKSDMEEA